MDTPVRFFASAEHRDFVSLNQQIFALEVEMRKRNYEEVRLALFRARIALGNEELAVRNRMAREDQEQPEGESP